MKLARKRYVTTPYAISLMNVRLLSLWRVCVRARDPHLH